MAHHSMASEAFTFDVADHLTGIALWDVPARPPVTSVGTGEEFEVDIAVLCLTAGCNLMGKTIQVVDEDFNLVAEGKTTEEFFNLAYMKYGYRGHVKVKAPEEPGTYTWYGQFPRQSKHSGVRVPLSVHIGRGFPSPKEQPIA